MLRCPWAVGDALLVSYHDREWGVPLHDDHRLFELLVLEGAQAGLSWLTVLRKREAYRRAFLGFDPERVAIFEATEVDRLMGDPGLIRNRAKLEAAVTNARATLRLREEAASLDHHLWSFVDHRPVHNAWRFPDEVPSVTEASQRMAADLRRRGFRFVGPTICYALMQAAGMVNDHLVSCFRHREVLEEGSGPREDRSVP